MQVNARNGQCAIEVDNAGSGDGEPTPDGVPAYIRNGRLDILAGNPLERHRQRTGHSAQADLSSWPVHLADRAVAPR